MICKVSSILLLSLAVGTCVATAIHRVHLSQGKPSNEGCNSGYGQTGDVPFKCSNGFACIDIVFMIRNACRACTKKGLMSSSEKDQCENIAQVYWEGGQRVRNVVKGLKVFCKGDKQNKRARGTPTCAFPTVGAKGWIDWTPGPRKICGCAKGFVNDCKGKDSSCVLDKINLCPKVCKGVKSRIEDARENSPLEAKGENDLKDRASLMVDAHGKTSRNASASMMSLDHTMSGKCSQ